MRNQFNRIPNPLYDIPSLQGVSVDTSVALVDRGVKKLPINCIGIKRGVQDDSILQGGDGVDKLNPVQYLSKSIGGMLSNPTL